MTEEVGSVSYTHLKMGLALADECTARGAKVILIAGPVQQGTYFPMHQYHAVCLLYTSIHWITVLSGRSWRNIRC